MKYPEFTKTALFWRQSYAIAMRRAPKITHRRRLILANGQAESSTELFLKELEGQITGVFLDFERTYARQVCIASIISLVQLNVHLIF